MRICKCADDGIFSMIRTASIVFLTLCAFISESAPLPSWFTRSYNDHKLNASYTILQASKPGILIADLDGDGKQDIAVQVAEKVSGKKGVLIIAGNQRHEITLFGAGKKIAGEGFSDINWQSGWKLLKNFTANQTIFSKDGDITGGKKIRLKYLAISVYKLEDKAFVAGIVIYWDGKRYITIHEGE
ncbi:hypothetical protein HQ865_14645 [Mucilaginibacter mali]|uniref:VCBS repeat-containing protein n=1 Tax=Mucilaginibacter mali TaxID=2740462 RepID=A0A7D4TVY9_9SPHI|nr:hypothetical protein [Mucilaginibacter mali]QKJ30935.1 hypothetical protein HQ865_14645 [Mucilaginibacter mali]